MKQSVLYSHFMAKKLGMEPENKELAVEGVEGFEGDGQIKIDEEAAKYSVDQIINMKKD